MDKKIIIFVTLFIAFLTLHCFCYEVSSFTELVYKRFYFIERLERPVELIKTCTIDDHIIVEVNHGMDYFKNKLIKESVKRIVMYKNLQPIEMTWSDFASFRMIDDESYLDDFTKLILIISEKILLQILPRLSIQSSNEIRQVCQKGLHVSLIERLEYIDLIYETFFMLHYKNNTNSIVLIDPIKTNYTESVTKRFYYVHRLRRPVRLILNDQENSEHYFNKIDKKPIIDEKVTFSHEYIIQTKCAMEKTVSLKPLGKVWKELEHYKFIEEPLIIKEFSKLIFILQKNKIFNSYHIESRNNSTSLEKLIHFYNNLDSLPLEEILDAIDILTNEFPAINEKFEINSDMSWRQWLKKYWWAPPLIFTMFAVKSLITIKHIKSLYEWIKVVLDDKKETA